jgi:hypothetical protein
MDNIIDMQQDEIHSRAHQKVWSRLMSAQNEVWRNRNDLSLKRYGSLEKEDIEMILQGNLIDQKVWSYILTLIEKNDKD